MCYEKAFETLALFYNDVWVSAWMRGASRDLRRLHDEIFRADFEIYGDIVWSALNGMHLSELHVYENQDGRLCLYSTREWRGGDLTDCGPVFRMPPWPRHNDEYAALVKGMLLRPNGSDFTEASLHERFPRKDEYAISNADMILILRVARSHLDYAETGRIWLRSRLLIHAVCEVLRLDSKSDPNVACRDLFIEMKFPRKVIISTSRQRARTPATSRTQHHRIGKRMLLMARVS
jgi:hypothetical protein